MARKREKQNISKLDRKIAKQKKELHDVLNDNKTKNEWSQKLEAKVLEEKIQTLEEKRYQKNRTTLLARERLYGKTISKYWTTTNKQKKAKKPRNILYSLVRLGSNSITQATRSSKMAQIARDHLLLKH
ncbi:hypothetical protein PHLCEN_2v1899 [Hermanssonia centrifuga]|uniref:Uncharacterized protein n=1 Tax=Hermanssonia centrifuga TaxID=98765 RepID=A0A2R6RVK0_9APHY|nr:hypothetical protein PHLCEN_2v1899 [Hermanssonia centrifuga]